MPHFRRWNYLYHVLNILWHIFHTYRNWDGPRASSGTKEAINHHNYVSGMPNLKLKSRLYSATRKLVRNLSASCHVVVRFKSRQTTHHWRALSSIIKELPGPNPRGPNALSTTCIIAITFSSSHLLPTICTPTGIRSIFFGSYTGVLPS